MIRHNEEFPNLIKYMGSKTNILEFVMEGISDAFVEDSYIVDLFAGSATLSGALRGHHKVISNDIQEYSKYLALAYLEDYDWDNAGDIIGNVVKLAEEHFNKMKEFHKNLSFNYSDEMSIEEFRKIEECQRELIKKRKWLDDYHLFTKTFSGTYWSFEQCMMIDSYKYAADQFAGKPYYYAIISSLMYAMSYNAQSTGHYAQYREAKDESSMKDIMIYRTKTITPFFERKMEAFRNQVGRNPYDFKSYSLDFKDCLKEIPENSVVYADPPYCFVHYSRFYHALETLVKYDHPTVLHKGRYRTDRHQSPFCIKSKVKDAFRDMFTGVYEKRSNLVLSYSNSGMITLEEINEIAIAVFENYSVELLTMDHKHSRMGRKVDKFIDVQEALIIAKRQQ